MSYTPGRFTGYILRRNDSVKRPGSVYPRPTYRNCFLLKQLASDAGILHTFSVLQTRWELRQQLPFAWTGMYLSRGEYTINNRGFARNKQFFQDILIVFYLL